MRVANTRRDYQRSWASVVTPVALCFEGFEPELQSRCIGGYIAKFSTVQIGAPHKPKDVFVSPACGFQIVQQMEHVRLFGKETVGCGEFELRIYEIRTRGHKQSAVEHETANPGLKATRISTVRGGGTLKHRVNTRICLGAFPPRGVWRRK